MGGFIVISKKEVDSMAEEEFVYKDISDLKREVEGMKGRKDISAKELHDAVQNLTQTIVDMLEVFGAAAEQLKLEEQEYEQESKKHEVILAKLDKIIDQNKTIAEGMVAIVEMVKEKIVAPAKEKEETMFRPQPEPRLFMRPPKPEWQPKPLEPIMPSAQMPPPMAPPYLATPTPEFGMPPMEPSPSPDLDFPEEPLEVEEPKKKGLFGMFKK